ncbi:MAG: VOC family protein [Alphaproteobacteria bacterium]|nr:VOC family protein [Alphaproteobacteria bacterium]MCY4318899.1 VOC family protein [Alphaproteobacteria bacterium]
MTFPLDHTGHMRADLDAGAAAWQRLGFLLSPETPQQGAVPGESGMQPWATANRCALFHEGYLELIGIRAPGRFNPWAHFMTQHEGIHIAAFRCGSADEAWPGLAAQGFAAPVQRARATPAGEMRFRNIFSEDASWPEGRIIVIEHQTPEVLWRPEFLDHPNGARALRQCLFVARRPEELAARLATLGAAPASHAVLSGEDFTTLFPGEAVPPLPCMAGHVVAFTDPDRAARLMASNGVPVGRDSLGRAFIGRPHNNGAVMVLIENSPA